MGLMESRADSTGVERDLTTRFVVLAPRPQSIDRSI